MILFLIQYTHSAPGSVDPNGLLQCCTLNTVLLTLCYTFLTSVSSRLLYLLRCTRMELTLFHSTVFTLRNSADESFQIFRITKLFYTYLSLFPCSRHIYYYNNILQYYIYIYIYHIGYIYIYIFNIVQKLRLGRQTYKQIVTLLR